MNILKQVPNILFGKGSFDYLGSYIDELQFNKGYIIYVVDDIHKKTGLIERIKLRDKDFLLFVDTKDEPKTEVIDSLKYEILNKNMGLPFLVVGLGGGSAMDIAKSLSIILTNEGSSKDYQGWDLVKNKPIKKMGVPTLFGTGSEATKTAVLSGPTKKMGINSKYSLFDAILLDPLLMKTVPKDQMFYTGMDCYIHCVESINGSFINTLVKPFVSSALNNCRDFFLKKEPITDEDREKLMVASYLGGLSVANSEVGVCHAMSYGISLVLGYHHGIANCIVFNQLREYYPTEVKEFKEMLNQNNIQLPSNVTKDLTEEEFNKMVDMAFKMEKPLTNALGPNWKEILTREKMIVLYKMM